MAKFFFTVIFVILFLFILESCGLEDSMYYNDPKNISVDGNRSGNIIVKFYGFNQEKGDDDTYLLVGYDIYYYFKDAPTKKKANVINPIIYTASTPAGNDRLYQFPICPGSDIDRARFPVTDFPASMTDFYKYIVTFPVTNDMIDNVLKESKNDNVRFGFNDSLNCWKTKDNNNNEIYYANPYKETNNEYIMLGNVYPNYNDYNGQTWSATNFKGFYDQRFYDNYSPKINPESSDVLYNYYKVNFYVIAKGFNSSFERNQTMIESYPSAIIEIVFQVPKI